MSIKYVVLDVDETLTEENGIFLPYTLSFIQDASKKFRVILSSCKTSLQLRDLVSYIGTKSPAIGECGCVIVLEPWNPSAEVLFLAPSIKRARKAFQLLEKEFADKVRSSWLNLYRKCTYLFYSSVEMEDLSKCLLKTDYTVLKAGKAMHIIKKGIHKGFGLRKLMEILGIEKSEVAMIGDSDTELSMLKEVGLSIALANATQTLKDECDYVTSKSYGKGTVEALNYLFSLRKRREE